MARRFILFLFLLTSLSLFGQNEGSDSIRQDSARTGIGRNTFYRAIKKFLNFSDYDTLYVSPNRYNYAFMTTHYTQFEYYSLSSSSPTPQRLSFSPKPRNKLGFYFGWRWIFLGWSFNIDDIYRETKRSNKGTEFDLSLYSSKLGLDVFYRRTGNSYKIHQLSGFPEEIHSGYSANFDGLQVDIRGLNVYYIFNNRRFSYPAAFSQSTNQRRNRGSLIAGFSFSKHRLDFDFSRMPEHIRQAINPEMEIERVKYANASLSLGYAYNWVFARNCLACLSLTPAIAYKESYLNAEAYTGKRHERSLNFDFLMRAAIVYNNGKYFAGSSFVGRNYGYNRKNFSLNNGYGVLQIYAGFNFNLKKEYRKKK